MAFNFIKVNSLWEYTVNKSCLFLVQQYAILRKGLNCITVLFLTYALLVWSVVWNDLISLYSLVAISCFTTAESEKKKTLLTHSVTLTLT